MINIHCPRKPYDNKEYTQGPWLELDENNVPIHPGDMQERIEVILNKYTGFNDVYTINPTAIAIIQKLCRQKKLNQEIQFWVHDYKNPLILDIEGNFVLPFPGEGYENILDATFHHRYA